MGGYSRKTGVFSLTQSKADVSGIGERAIQPDGLFREADQG